MQVSKPDLSISFEFVHLIEFGRAVFLHLCLHNMEAVVGENVEAVRLLVEDLV